MFKRYVDLIHDLYGKQIHCYGTGSETEILLMHAVDESLANLDEREADVLRSRYAIHQPRQTLKQVGVAHGISGGRVRIIEAEALRKLRTTRRGYPLRICLFATDLVDASSGFHDPRVVFALRNKAASGVQLSEEELESVPIESLDLSQRTLHCLKNDHIKTLYDLCCMSKWRLLLIPNFGRKCLAEIISVLKEYGQTLMPSE